VSPYNFGASGNILTKLFQATWWTLVHKEKSYSAHIDSPEVLVQCKLMQVHSPCGSRIQFSESFASCHCCEGNFDYVNWLSTRTCGAGRPHVGLCPILLVSYSAAFLYQFSILFVIINRRFSWELEREWHFLQTTGPSMTANAARRLSVHPPQHQETTSPLNSHQHQSTFSSLTVHTLLYAQTNQELAQKTFKKFPNFYFPRILLLPPTFSTKHPASTCQWSGVDAPIYSWNEWWKHGCFASPQTSIVVPSNPVLGDFFA